MSDHEMTVMTFNGKTFEVDGDIADLVHALNTAGIATVASCSGHGMRPGRISLADGRELFVLPGYEIAQWFDTQFPRNINGQTADERTEMLRTGNQVVREQWDGMTLRDYFAAKAMAALIAEPVSEGWPSTVSHWASQLQGLAQMSGPDVVAHVAYMMADAMLRAREASND